MPGHPQRSDLIETVIVPRTSDLGGFEVRRVLPSRMRQMVGPFIFFDHMGPVEFSAGNGIDVRPHPHINLATVTYLFDGEIIHRDSLGTMMPIRPGAVNWMTAGRGIVHSERTSPELKARGSRVFGLQTWVAMPAAHEETDPSFVHYEARNCRFSKPKPSASDWWSAKAGDSVRPSRRSPTRSTPMSCLNPAMLPLETAHEERAVYVVSGEVTIGSDHFPSGQLLVLRQGTISVRNAEDEATRLVLVGGETMDGPRHIWWNFVSSRLDRIEQAKADWKVGRFGTVPGDAEEFIPLPAAEEVAGYP